MIAVKIYALINPLNKSVFYVGRTCGSLSKRLLAHMRDAETNPKKQAIINEIVSSGDVPTILCIENYLCENEDQEAHAISREGFWINHYLSIGIDLCNANAPNPETKPRLLSAYQKASYKSKVPTGIRFNLDQVDIVKEREGLRSNQQVVDFLLARYCNDIEFIETDYIKGSAEEM